MLKLIFVGSYVADDDLCYKSYYYKPSGVFIYWVCFRLNELVEGNKHFFS